MTSQPIHSRVNRDHDGSNIAVQQVLAVVALMVSAWALIRPWPYAWAIGTVMIYPVFIMGVAGVMRLRGGYYDWLMAVPAIGAPAMALFFRTAFGVELLHYGGSLAVAAVFGMACTVGVTLVEKGIRPSVFVWTALAFSLYGWACALHLNKVLDPAEPHAYPVQVEDRRIRKSRGSTYYVTLASWDLRPYGEEITVSETFYDTAAPGATVCVYVHPGRFGWPYRANANGRCT